MKKIYSILLISLLIIAPITFAERSSDRQQRSPNNLDSAENIERKVDSIVLDRVKERTENIKEHLVEIRRIHNDKKSIVRENKEKLKRCRNSITEECEEHIRNAKEFILNIADRVIEHLELIKTKIEESDRITDEEATEIISDINNKISQIEAAKTEVEAAATNEEIKEASQKLKRLLREIKNTVKINELRSLHLGIGKIINRAQILEDDIQCTIDHLKSESLDTTKVESLYTDYQSSVDSAQESYNAAFDKFKEAKNSNSVDLLKDGKLLIRETISHIKEAKKTFHEIRATTKQLGSHFERCNSPKDLPNVDSEEAITDE